MSEYRCCNDMWVTCLNTVKWDAEHKAMSEKQEQNAHCMVNYKCELDKNTCGFNKSLQTVKPSLEVPKLGITKMETKKVSNEPVIVQQEITFNHKKDINVDAKIEGTAPSEVKPAPVTNTNPKTPVKSVILLSGGLDSTTLLYDVKSKGEEVYAISFAYGQKHKKELEYAMKTCVNLNIPHKVLMIKALGDIAPSALTTKGVEIPEGHYEEENMKATVVPNRNMVLLSLCVAYAIRIGASKVYYGAHAGDHTIYPDCRKEFVEAMQKVIELCDWSKVVLEAPYLSLSKGQIVEIGSKLNVDYSLTWTCYKGNELACGKCGSCQERLEAFKLNNLTDPLKYGEEKKTKKEVKEKMQGVLFNS